MLTQFTGLFWFVLVILPLVVLQRLLHREIQAVILILTRNPPLTVGLFSILFLPGVILHEFSHFITAKILGVRTGGFSIIPRPLPDGRLQLGYVETSKSDIVRDSLIGAAPLIAGSLFVAYTGINHLHLNSLWNFLLDAQFELFWMGLGVLPQIEDFYLWFYLIFTVSSTMMPSASDRHAWLPLGLWVVILFGLALLAGAGPWMLENLAPFLNNFLSSVAVLLGLSAGVHAISVLPVMLTHRVLTRLTGVDVK
jgi:hypothetical protein